MKVKEDVLFFFEIITAVKHLTSKTYYLTNLPTPDDEN